ncbi:MAG: outer membrane lipoprotein carrier protein LolA [Planctomycetota bacterium]
MSPVVHPNKRWSALVLAFVVSAAYVTSSGSLWAEAPSPQTVSDDAWEPLAALLQSRDANGEDPVGTRGHFEQHRTSMLLAKPLVSCGHFAVAGEIALFETRSPLPSVMLVTPERVTVFDPVAKTSEQYTRDTEAEPDPATDVLGLLLARDVSRLRASFFAVRDEPLDQGGTAFRLSPRPHEHANRHDAQAPKVWLELGSDLGEPRRLRIQQPEGDELELHFTQISSDAAITPDALLEEAESLITTEPKAP